MNTIGERIKIVRNKVQLTQAMFGETVGVSHSHISKMESDKEFPSNTLVKLICIKFGINEEWLNTGKGEMIDAVNEDDKENNKEHNVEALVSGIGKLQKLLENSSNVKYAYIANSLDAFADLFDYHKVPSEIQNDYLDHIYRVIGSIYHFNSLLRTSTIPAYSTSKPIDDMGDIYNIHLQGIIHDLNELYRFYVLLEKP